MKMPGVIEAVIGQAEKLVGKHNAPEHQRGHEGRRTQTRQKQPSPCGRLALFQPGPGGVSNSADDKRRCESDRSEQRDEMEPETEHHALRFRSAISADS